MDWLHCDASSWVERSNGKDCRDLGPNRCAPFPQVHVRMLQQDDPRKGAIVRLSNSSVRTISSLPKEVSPSASPISPFGFGRTDCESHSTDDDDEEREEEEFPHHRSSYEISVASSSDTAFDLLNSFTNALTDCLQLAIKEAHVCSTFGHHAGSIALGHFVVMQEESCGPAGSHNSGDPPEALKQGILEILRILENLRRGHCDSGNHLQGTETAMQAVERRHLSDVQTLRSAVEDLTFGDFSIDFKDVKIGARIGGGSSGDIHRGTYHMQNVAIKIINLVRDEDDDLTDFSGKELLQMFRQEVSTMRLAHHKNLIQFIGACSCWPKLWIVTELMLGNVLETRGPDPEAVSVSHSGRASGGTLNPVDEDMSRSVQILKDVASGMDFLHRKGVMHRDLKAANFLVDDHGVVKVCDFGLARPLKATNASTPGDSPISGSELRPVGSIAGPPSNSDKSGMMTGATGTVKWMAPEVLMHKPYNHKADVYSFGIAISEIVTREVPYAGLTPRRAANGVLYQGLRPSLPTSVPPKLARLAQQCWDKNPEVRPEFCEIAAVLDELSVELSGPCKKKKKRSVFRTVRTRWLFSRGA